jgi:hypothetical protein
VFFLPRDALSVANFNANRAFLGARLPRAVIRDTKIFEKQRVEWLSLDGVRRRLQRGQFRSFYRPIVRQLLERAREIAAFAKRAAAVAAPARGSRRARHTRRRRVTKSRRR